MMSLAVLADVASKLNPFSWMRFATLFESTGDHQTRCVRIRALGGFEVTIDRTPVHQLGGKHAGSRQSQALLAMLFDRGPQGVSKDEVIDTVWPESDISVADLAFHRTLGGLRRVLAPHDPRQAVRYVSGRYRMGSAVSISSDVADFENLIERAAMAPIDQRARLLESAQELYGGDYLDDCAYYGDSAAVEERRVALRQLYLHVGLELSAIYRSRGLSTLALLRAAEGRRRLANDAGWDLEVAIAPTAPVAANGRSE